MRNLLIRILQSIVILAVVVSVANAGGGATMMMIGGTAAAAGGGACTTPIFADNFNRADNDNVYGPGGWYTEVDAATSELKVVSNTLQMTNAVPTGRYVTKRSLGSVADTYVKFTLKLSHNTSMGAFKNIIIANIEGTTTETHTHQLRLKDDTGTGVLNAIQLIYHDGSATQTLTYSWSPVAGTTYTIKTRYKSETSHPTSNDAILGLWIDGASVINGTSLSNRETTSDRATVGSLSNGITNTSLVITYDDYAVYNCDPDA